MKRPLVFRFWSTLLGLIVVALLVSCAQSAAPGDSQPAVSTAAPAAEPSARLASRQQSAKLGTQWGEGIDSHTRTVALSRVSNTPLSVTQIDYSARRQQGREINEVMLANGRIGLSVLNDHGGKWTLTQNGQRIHLRGKDGERYQLFYRSYSNRTYEIVATVDGLDVINGSAGSLSNGGYVLKPHGTLLIEGFRKNADEVAAFRFSAVKDSYAANTPAGSPKNAGVIGTAVFELVAPRVRRAPSTSSPQAFPGDRSNDRNNGDDSGNGNGYAPPPDYDE